MSEVNDTRAVDQDNGKPITEQTVGNNRLPAEEETLDPFDPERLKLSQDFASSIGVKKELITVPVRKPSKEWFVQVNPDPDMRLQTAVIELKEDRGETYIVAPSLWSALSTEATFSPRLFVTAISRQGVLFLWPIRLPGADGKIDEWSKSALEAANLARGRWVRVAANMSLGAYEVFAAPAELNSPEWPDKSLRDLLSIAFKDRYIDTLDHPVLKTLRGEI
jgi:hypothetical protein